MPTLWQRLSIILNGLPADAYDDEPVGEVGWNSEYGTRYRPAGRDYRVVQIAQDLRLEIQGSDGEWRIAEQYDPGYDDMGKLHKGHWCPLFGSRAGSTDSYRRIGNALTGKNVEPFRRVVLTSDAA